MKAVMYHYVRSASYDLPYFTYLDVDNFKRQLDFFSQEFGFVRQEDFASWIQQPHAIERPDGVILTFDDGFRDHVDTVQPILKELNLWGIFYIPTHMLSTGEILDVHKIHLLLGKLGPERCLELLNASSAIEMFPDIVVEDFRLKTYSRQTTSSEQTKTFKRMLNYFVDYQWRRQLLDRLEISAFEIAGYQAPDVSDVYITTEELRALSDDGHIIGSHSVSHRLMSKLSAEAQAQEIYESQQFLEAICGREVATYCHPYGGFHSFNDDTERILSAAGFRYSFNVEARDIDVEDLVGRPQALPRYDCNLFPYGQATVTA